MKEDESNDKKIVNGLKRSNKKRRWKITQGRTDTADEMEEDTKMIGWKDG